MAVTYLPRDVRAGQAPEGLVINVATTNLRLLSSLAGNAAAKARAAAPKSSGEASQGIEAIYGPGWFGIRWSHPYLWYQDQGIGPYTMHSLRGKTIPMWIEDRDGSETAKIPAKDRVKRTRVTIDGRRQVLIFRKATKPGAPGRIEAAKRRRTGHIGQTNVGVKWRHPGLRHRGFLGESMLASLNHLRGVAAYGDLRPVTLRKKS